MFTCSTPAEIARLFAWLLPPGIALDAKFEEDSELYPVIEALSAEVSRADCRATALIDEALPDTTTELLEDWERMLGLPESCIPEAFSTIGQRRNMVLFKLRLIGQQDPAFYIELAAVLGYTITITEFSAARAGLLRTGERLIGPDWLFWWQVNTALNTIFEFRAGQSQAGDALRQWGDDGLECILNKYKPAHTRILFSYT